MKLENEKLLKDYPKPIFINETETILNQMKNYVYQICKKDGSKGTGFFCKIPLSEKTNLAAFITNNHVIDEEFLMEEKDIIILTNDGKNIKINHLDITNKFKYTNKDDDITIIPINEQKDKIQNFLELDENIFNDNINYVGKSIYILHYPDYFEQDKVAVSYGVLKRIYEDKKMILFIIAVQNMTLLAHQY